MEEERDNMEEKCKSGGRTEEIGRKVQKRRKNGGDRRKSGGKV